MRDLEVVTAGMEVVCAAATGFAMRAKKDCNLIDRFRTYWDEVEEDVRRTR